MKIRPTSFRTRIIVTLIVVTSAFSFLSFQIYSLYLSKRIYQNTEDNIISVLYFLRDEIINIHDGRLIKPLLANMGRDQRVLSTYLLDGSRNIVFSNNENTVPFDTTDFNDFANSEEEILVKTYGSLKHPVSRAFLHVHNEPRCYECHAPEQNTLGYVVFDLSLRETGSSLIYTRNFSFLFTFSMVLIILAFVLVLHYRFIRKSLSQFQDAIIGINKGDLGQRVYIKESSELGELGESFNHMLDSFQQAQHKLAAYHKKELEATEKLATVGEMAARLAHDVRNPLTGIANSIEIIASEMDDQSPNKPILEELKRQAGRVNNAISNLLKYSRALDVKKENRDINELIQSLVFFLKSQKQNRCILVRFHEGKGIPRMYFDPAQIENVLMNLCMNSIQAMKNSGKIIIHSEYDDVHSNVKITIEDNGPGIPVHQINDIFKPFFTTKTEGTGLGLAISKDIIEKHDGRIWCKNKSDGGAVFYITLPVVV